MSTNKVLKRVELMYEACKAWSEFGSNPDQKRLIRSLVRPLIRFFDQKS